MRWNTNQRIAGLSLVLIPLGGCAASPRLTVDPQIAEMVRRVDARRIESDIRRLAAFGTRHTLSETESDTRGIGAARRWLRDEFQRISRQSGGRLRVELDGYRQEPDGKRITRPVEIVNVVATLPGSQPESTDRVYVVSGHYDSRASDPLDYESDAPGADDDASGVAAVLELARVMSPYQFDATVVFMAVAGEEQGLHGSAHAARKARAADVNIGAMITNDIIGSSLSADGRRDNRRVRVFSAGLSLVETPAQAEIRQKVGGENDAPARQLARYIDRACDAYVPGFDVVTIFRLDRFLRGGDHKSYSLQGYPAVRFTEMNENYAHQHQDVRIENGIQFGDLPQFVDFDYVADVARANIAALASLARAPDRPKNVRIITAKLTNDTTLRWNVNAEPDLSGYVILWRQTDAPQWQHAAHVGRVTEHTLPLSKDNYFFGVCAVDQEGHRSQAVFPTPSKK